MGDGRNDWNSKKRVSPEEPGEGFAILENWDAIEADFQREYGIDLSQEMDQMTHRRFIVLLHNLGPESSVANRLRGMGRPEKGAYIDQLM